MREFDTGATRDSDVNKYDYDGFLSPLVLERYAKYMHKHRKQADGKLRDSGNWKKGIPIAQYMKSKWRHFIDTWKWFRLRSDAKLGTMDAEESLCAELFNTMGILHEILNGEVEKVDENIGSDIDRTKPVPGGY